MAVLVPDTSNFSLQDVYNAVNDHASPGTNLSSCFSNANSDYFDPTYNTDSYAPANSMLRFRNYGPKSFSDPTTENHLLYNPFSSSEHTQGRLVYMSKDGYHFYMLVNYEPDNDLINRLIRYELSTPFHLDTATYHSSRSITSAGSSWTSFTWQDMRLSPGGNKLFLFGTNGDGSMADVNPVIRTITLANSWDISSNFTSSLDTELETVGIYKHGVEFAFSEDGMMLSVLEKYNSILYMHFYDLYPTAYSISATSPLPFTSYSTFSDTHFNNEVHGLELYDQASTPHFLFGLDDVYTRKVNVNPSTWECQNPIQTVWSDTTFDAVVDMCSSPNGRFHYILENNVGTVFPLVRTKVTN